MESQVVVDIAGSTETPAVSKNISVSDLANRRIGQLAGQGVVDEDQDSGEETLESESLDPEGDQNQEEVLSQLNL